jgi:hypothetical protein
MVSPAEKEIVMAVAINRSSSIRRSLFVALSMLATLSVAPDARAQTVQYCVDGPCGVRLVGTSGGVADPHGEITLKIGLAPLCTPLANVPVTLEFGACDPDIRLCELQPGWSGAVSCRMLFGFTDNDGSITFRLVGGATNTTGAAPGYGGAACTGGCVVVRVNEMIASQRLSVAAYDQNGSGGVNPADISVWLVDTFSNTYFARSDFDFNNAVTPADLSLLLDVSLDGQSAQSCNFYCL